LKKRSGFIEVHLAFEGLDEHSVDFAKKVGWRINQSNSHRFDSGGIFSYTGLGHPGGTRTSKRNFCTIDKLVGCGLQLIEAFGEFDRVGCIEIDHSQTEWISHLRLSPNHRNHIPVVMLTSSESVCLDCHAAATAIEADQAIGQRE